MPSEEERKQKEFDDLHGPLHRLLMFSRPAFDIVANYRFIEDLGKNTLIQNMNYCKDVLNFATIWSW